MTFERSEKRYRTVSDYYQDTFQSKVFKVPLNAGFTCPNKDGTKGVGGCIYCSPSGSGDFAGDVRQSLKHQYDTVKAQMITKWPDAKPIVYFQANTNTYADVAYLRKIFTDSLTFDENIVGLAIATRCDALDEAKIALLSELARKTHVQVELGLQTIHEDTAATINRGHDLDCFTNAVKALRAAGIETVVHIINGLPGEDKAMMIKTVEWLNNLDIQGIKIHMLHVMKETELARLYQENPFNLLSLDEYVDITVAQIERLKPSIVVHRVTGDSPKDALIAPTWTLKKFVVMNEIDKLMRKKNTVQGVLTSKR